MQKRQVKLLNDIARACKAIQQFTAGQTVDGYAADMKTQSAVERQFGIIGEALRKLEIEDAALAHRVSDWHRIIGFRNIVVHGYDSIDDLLVWQTVTDRVPILVVEVQQLLAEMEGSKPTS